MSVYEPSEALRSTHEYNEMVLSSHKCASHHDIMLMSAYECSSCKDAILMSVHGYLGLLSSVHGY